MTNFVRRAKAVLLRFLDNGGNPSTLSGSAQLFAKSVSGTKLLFGIDGGGNVTQGLPYLGLAKNVMAVGDDFVMGGVNTTGATSSATANFGGEQGSPGIISSDIVTVNSRVALTPTPTLVATLIVGDGVIVFEGRCRTPIDQDATDQWSDRWGVADNTASNDVTDGCYFESDRATFGDNNVRLCCAAGGTRTKTSMGVAPTTNTFERWKLVINADATSVQGYLNDTLTGSAVTTNIPSGSSNNTGVYTAQVIKTAGTNARSIERDYLQTYQVFSPTMR